MDSTPSFSNLFCSVQSLSHVQFFATPWTTACQASLSITSSQSPPKPMSIESVMPSNHLILCHPLLLLPSIFPSIRIFSNESALHVWWPKYWSFSFSISPSNEHPGLISFRMDWLDLLAVQGTLKSVLQHHSSKASILQHSAFFIVQISHPYMTTGKTIAFLQKDPLEDIMATHSSILAWRIPRTEESGGLQSIGLPIIGHKCSDWGSSEIIDQTRLWEQLGTENGKCLSTIKLDSPLRIRGLLPFVGTHVFAVLPITSQTNVPEGWFLATGNKKI